MSAPARCAYEITSADETGATSEDELAAEDIASEELCGMTAEELSGDAADDCGCSSEETGIAADESSSTAEERFGKLADELLAESCGRLAEEMPATDDSGTSAELEKAPGSKKSDEE